MTPPDTKKPTSDMSWLSRRLLWTDKPEAVNGIFYGLIAICLALAAIDFVIHRHTYFDVEHITFVYGIFGFLVYGTVVFLAKGLRVFIRRPEDYYGTHATDSEPEDLAGTESLLSQKGEPDV
ncbi:MAG: hypothetical protein GC184_12020 [Rhizobiales bacterium]|nr:hypothetical protein [Hyphomicrobiales bacterium]